MTIIKISAVLSVIAIATTVAAQTPPPFLFSTVPPTGPREMPKTAELRDANGKLVGTATGDGVRMYYRNGEGEFIGSSVIADGRMTFYDPNGKVVRIMTNEGNVFKNTDADGNLTFTTTIEKDGRVTYRDASGKIIEQSPKQND